MPGDCPLAVLLVAAFIMWAVLVPIGLYFALRQPNGGGE